MTQVAEIWGLVEPYLARERLELDDVEMVGGPGGRVLRLTIDGEGVDVERLAELSRGLSRLLDHEAGLEGGYQLEVSSPGLERKLRRPEHYGKSVGREVVVKVKRADRNETLRGVLTEAGADSFTVDGERGADQVGYADVVSARTVFRWEKPPKPGH